MAMDNSAALISRIHESSNSFITEQLRARDIEGIVPSHGSILANLIKAKEMTLTDIAVAIRRDRSTVTTLVKKLQALGYVSTSKNKSDGRSTKVSLTQQGEDIIPAFTEISQQLFGRFYAGFTEAERSTFRALLVRVLQNLEEGGRQ